MSELKPCPFCGNPAIISHQFWNAWWAVGCMNNRCICHVHDGKPYETEREAIAAWNTRTGWNDGEPTSEHTREYIVKDATGIISGRLYHPDKGWGEPGRPPHKDVAQWMEIPG